MGEEEEEVTDAEEAEVMRLCEICTLELVAADESLTSFMAFLNVIDPRLRDMMFGALSIIDPHQLAVITSLLARGMKIIYDIAEA